MNHKLLGSSGLRVSELGLGTVNFGTAWGWGTDDQIIRHRWFDRYEENPINDGLHPDAPTEI